MKDFDEARRARAERDRSFKLGGETFVMKTGVRPETLTEYSNLQADAPAEEALKVIDDLIVSLIEDTDDAAERYRAVRANDNDPVTLEDLQALVEWLVEEQTNRRPTRPLSPSSSDSVRTGIPSTDVSSSPVERPEPVPSI